MKVLLLNGSPHPQGCTATALEEIARVLRFENVDTEIVHVGGTQISGCMGCGACRRSGKCIRNEAVNRITELAKDCDGFVFGSPVHYAAASGTLTALLDCCFYSASGAFAFKPAACIVSCRRGGATAAFEQLNKYLTINQMPVVSGQYWNMVHGNTPEEVLQDEEGLQTMRSIGRNMAWLLHCIQAGKEAGIDCPTQEPRKRTNFIR